jgi:5-(aminomethyl)-3-furanmethanol phosphate kinase
MPTRVVKVGGSLLNWPPLPGVLRKWLKEQPPAVNVLLCGGGPLADVVRQLDRDFSLGEEAAHWLCIDTLSLSARFLAALLGDVRLVSSLDELRGTLTTTEHAIIVFDPRAFLYDDETRLPGRPLPHNWSVTSDSIAARLAETLPADELVLLKSANPAATALTDLAALEFVDLYFPIAAQNAPRSRFVNLRLADL